MTLSPSVDIEGIRISRSVVLLETPAGCAHVVFASDFADPRRFLGAMPKTWCGLRVGQTWTIAASTDSAEDILKLGADGCSRCQESVAERRMPMRLATGSTGWPQPLRAASRRLREQSASADAAHHRTEGYHPSHVPTLSRLPASRRNLSLSFALANGGLLRGAVSGLVVAGQEFARLYVEHVAERRHERGVKELHAPALLRDPVEGVVADPVVTGFGNGPRRVAALREQVRDTESHREHDENSSYITARLQVINVARQHVAHLHCWHLFGIIRP